MFSFEFTWIWPRKEESKAERKAREKREAEWKEHIWRTI